MGKTLLVTLSAAAVCLTLLSLALIITACSLFVFQADGLCLRRERLGFAGRLCSPDLEQLSTWSRLQDANLRPFSDALGRVTVGLGKEKVDKAWFNRVYWLSALTIIALFVEIFLASIWLIAVLRRGRQRAWLICSLIWLGFGRGLMGSGAGIVQMLAACLYSRFPAVPGESGTLYVSIKSWYIAGILALCGGLLGLVQGVLFAVTFFTRPKEEFQAMQALPEPQPQPYVYGYAAPVGVAAPTTEMMATAPVVEAAPMMVATEAPMALPAATVDESSDSSSSADRNTSDYPTGTHSDYPTDTSSKAPYPNYG